MNPKAKRIFYIPFFVTKGDLNDYKIPEKMCKFI